MATYASVTADSNYLENIMDSNPAPNNFDINNDISMKLIESGKKNSRDIKNFKLLGSELLTSNLKNNNNAASLEENEYKEIELDENGCQSYLHPTKSTHWCESQKKCLKLNEKCNDWETDINKIIKEESEKLDITKMQNQLNEMRSNLIIVDSNNEDNEIDLSEYGLFEILLLVVISLSLLIFLVRNHR